MIALVIVDHRHDNQGMDVLFIFGPAASGKYSIGQTVSEQLELPLFHNHLVVDAVRVLFDFGTPGFCQLRADMWLSAFRTAAKHQQSFVFTFHPERTVAPELPGLLEQAVTSQGGAVHHIELVCDEEQLIKRLNSETRQHFGKLNDVNLYQQIKADGGFDFPAFCQPVMSLDTSRLSAQQSALRIIDWFRHR
jgi:hypothetical protein